VSPRAGDHPLAVVLAQAHPQLGPRTGRHFVTLGHLWPRQGRIARGDRAILTQEVRSPRAGRFHFLVHARGAGASAQHYRDFFLKHFTCRLSIFGYTDERKDPTGPVRQYAAVDFQPPFIDGQADRYEQFKVSARLRSQDDGAREIERGVGVAVIVEKTSPGDLDVAGVPGAFICIDDVQLIFDPRPRDDSVQV
jgi:hypothetical protein